MMNGRWLRAAYLATRNSWTPICSYDRKKFSLAPFSLFYFVNYWVENNIT